MSVFHHRSLLCRRAGSVTVLDAVSIDMGDTQELRFYFQSGTPVDMLVPLKEYKFKSNRSIGGGLLSIAEAHKDLATPPLPLRGQRLPVAPNHVESALFAGLKTLIAQRNGESAETVLEWLKYHATVHGAEGVIILDRTEPDTDRGFARTLENTPVEGIKTLVVVNSPVPLGAKGMSDEAHAFNAPDAPGKDRMEVPPVDPWRAPIGDILFYELFKTRFLSEASAVVNIDCYDMLARLPNGTIFDAVQKSETGALLLLGQRCYPWRLRKGQKPSFGDHICRQFDATKANRRWAIDMSRVGIDRIWRLARVIGADAAPPRYSAVLSLYGAAASLRICQRNCPQNQSG